MIVEPPMTPAKTTYECTSSTRSTKRIDLYLQLLQQEVLLLQKDNLEAQKLLYGRQMEVTSLQQQYYRAKVAKLTGQHVFFD